MTRDNDHRTGGPRLLALGSWAVLAASFAMSASTWINLAGLAGFTDTIGGFRLAWCMPIAVDGYVVVALMLWMSPVPAHVARFARTNTYAAASVGVVAQSAYHALTIWDTEQTMWRSVMAAAVGAMPPALAALSVHMRALRRRESRIAIPDADVDMATDVQIAPPQVTAPVEVDTTTDMADATEPPRTPVRPARPRPFATTQRVAAALQSDGMEVPEIADVLAISERQVRRALKPVPVPTRDQ